MRAGARLVAGGGRRGLAGVVAAVARAHDAAAAPLLVVGLAAVGGAWHHDRWALFEADDVGLLAPEAAAPAALEVRVAGPPRWIAPPPFDAMRTLPTPERTRLEVAVVAIRDGDAWRRLDGSATLTVDGPLLDVAPGDRLRVFGTLAAISPPHNPGEFDFARRARAGRRLCSLWAEFPECVTTVAAGSRWSWSRGVNWLRSRGEALLWSGLGDRRTRLAAAMFLGSREELDPEESQAFLETGTIHLLVISGLNVGILAGCLFLAMRLALVPRGWALACVALACVLYAATTDVAAARRAGHGDGARRLPGHAAGTPGAGLQLDCRGRPGRAGAQPGRAVSGRHAALVSVGGRAGLAGAATRRPGRRPIRSIG